MAAHGSDPSVNGIVVSQGLIQYKPVENRFRVLSASGTEFRSEAEIPESVAHVFRNEGYDGPVYTDANGRITRENRMQIEKFVYQKMGEAVERLIKTARQGEPNFSEPLLEGADPKLAVQFLRHTFEHRVDGVTIRLNDSEIKPKVCGLGCGDNFEWRSVTLERNVPEKALVYTTTEQVHNLARHGGEKVPTQVRFIDDLKIILDWQKGEAAILRFLDTRRF